LVEYKSNENGGQFRRLKFTTIILGAIALGSSLTYAAMSNAVARGDDRTISLRGVHTKDTLTITYKRDGQYDQAALEKINYFMRDWRAKQPTKMDPALIDLLWELHKELGSKKPIHLISGYRSSKTNTMLRRIGRGVARRSMHIKGQAADVFFPDVPIKKLRESALLRERGGVGYYPRSGKHGFVHVDTGRVRHWPRMSPTRLAALFRKNKTKHKPGSAAPTRFASHKTHNHNFAEIQPTSGGLRRIPIPQHKSRVVLASLPQEATKTRSIAKSELAAVPKPRIKPALAAKPEPLFAAVKRAQPIITASISPSIFMAPPRVKPVLTRSFAKLPNAAKPRRSAKGDLQNIHIASAAAGLTAREQIAPGLTINRSRKGNLLMSSHGSLLLKFQRARQLRAYKPAASDAATKLSSLN